MASIISSKDGLHSPPPPQSRVEFRTRWWPLAGINFLAPGEDFDGLERLALSCSEKPMCQTHDSSLSVESHSLHTDREVNIDI